MPRKKSATAILEPPAKSTPRTLEEYLQEKRQLQNGRPLPVHNHPWFEGGRQQQYQRVAQCDIYDPAVMGKDFLTPKLAVARVGKLTLESVLLTQVKDFEIPGGTVKYIEQEQRITIRGLAKTIKVTKDRIIKLIQKSVQKWILYERRYMKENVFKVAGENISLGTVKLDVALSIITKLADARCKKAREFLSELVLNQKSVEHPFCGSGYGMGAPHKKYLGTAWKEYYSTRGLR